MMGAGNDNVNNNNSLLVGSVAALTTVRYE